MRFVDFLKTTVLLSAGAATALAAITVIAASSGGRGSLLLISLGWWVLATVVGLRLGRRAEATPPIARLLARAKARTTLPEHRPGAILLNRLWPLLLFTLVAGGLGFLAPQIPGIATGFAIIWALAWRRQHCRGRGDRGARRRALLRATDLAGASRSRSSARPASRPCAPSTSTAP